MPPAGQYMYAVEDTDFQGGAVNFVGGDLILNAAAAANRSETNIRGESLIIILRLIPRF